jgi:HK97 family phage portal protein
MLKPSPLLEQPYAEISRTDWWTQFIWALALQGNFFGQIIERDGNGYPVQIKPINNDSVTIKRLPDGTLEYRFYSVVVPFKDVFHIRYQSHPGSYIGLNPIEVCALAFGLNIAQTKYAEMFFENSATPRGVIEVQGPLDLVETRKMMRGWLAAQQGLNQAHLPAILTEGAKFNPITISPQDSQLLEAMGFSSSQISGQIFRIPPHMIGMVDRTTSWGRGIEAMERGFFTNTLVGYLTRGAEAMTRVHPPGQFVGWDTSERLRGTALERAQTGSLAMLAGAWCADDFRDTFDQPPLPNGEGKNVYVPINTELLQAALQALKESQDAANEPQQEPQEPSGNGNGGGGNFGRAQLIDTLQRAMRS